MQTHTDTPLVENGDNLKKVFWPLDLLPDTLPDCRTYTWGYSADILGGSTTTVFQHARNLLSNVADVRVSAVDRKRPILWVVHSLGGIIVKDALNQARTSPTYLRDILPATYGVCFLGTPHRGTSLATLGETVARVTNVLGWSPSLQVLQALKYDAETLDRIQRHFKETLELCKSQGRQISICSFCEANKTSGILVSLCLPNDRSHHLNNDKVVDHFSSMIDDVYEIVNDVPANHLELSKFSSIEDPCYVNVSNALQRWMTEIRERASVGGYHSLWASTGLSHS